MTSSPQLLDQFLADLTDTIRRQNDLITWLARKWGPNNPDFPEVDPQTNTALPGNAELSATWYEVVRGGLKCEVCQGSGYSGRTEKQPDVFELEVCARCTGQGFTTSPPPGEEASDPEIYSGPPTER